MTQLQGKSGKLQNLCYLFSLNYCSPSWHDCSSCSHVLSFHVLVQVSHFALSSSPSLALCVFIKAESYYTLRVSASTTDWGSAEGRGQCGAEFFRVCRQIMCGGGGAILRSLSPVVECMLRCPGLTLPEFVYVCACMRLCSWVSKSFVAESSLNKGSF